MNAVTLSQSKKKNNKQTDSQPSKQASQNRRTDRHHASGLIEINALRTAYLDLYKGTRNVKRRALKTKIFFYCDSTHKTDFL